MFATGVMACAHYRSSRRSDDEPSNALAPLVRGHCLAAGRAHLAHAYRLARAAGGAPGVDGQSFEDMEGQGLEEWLVALREELRTRTYRPAPVRRVMIPKPGGGERPLGIPTVPAYYAVVP